MVTQYIPSEFSPVQEITFAITKLQALADRAISEVSAEATFGR
jgi:hypothetical protein